jgi:hypothetical protein
MSDKFEFNLKYGSADMVRKMVVSHRHADGHDDHYTLRKALENHLTPSDIIERAYDTNNGLLQNNAVRHPNVPKHLWDNAAKDHEYLRRYALRNDKYTTQEHLLKAKKDPDHYVASLADHLLAMPPHV